MKCGIVFFAVLALAASEIYNTEHEDMDVNLFFSNTELLKSFLDCFIDKGPCNETQQDFKSTLAEGIQTACAKCSPARKSIARNFMAALQEKMPDGFTLFQNKYDPEDKYFTKLQESVANAQ